MEKIIIHHTSSFNHGCQDSATVVGGVVVAVQNCTSCWQVGHDADHVFAKIGDKVEVREVNEYGESEDFSFVEN